MGTKINSVLNKYIVLLALIVFNTPGLLAQSIGVPITYSPVPCSGGTSTQYTGAICLNSCYYQNASVEFTYSGFSGGSFILELSNSSGSFLSPTQLGSATTVTSSPGRITFNWPQNVSGSGYKLRVKCNSPSIIGASTGVGFSAYYKSFNQGFWINNRNSTVHICNGGSYPLSIDNPTPNIQASSPVNYPNLTYRWYNGTNIIPGQTGPSLNVTASGVYYVEIDYGACSVGSLTYSQSVTVDIMPVAPTFTITQTGPSEICSTTPTVLSTTQGYAYQWYRNTILIPGATSYSYNATQPGAYYVAVQSGCSSTSNTVNLTAEDFNASIDIPTDSFILPGEIKVVTVTTDATNPTYQWYSGSPLQPIPGETNISYSATSAGEYKVTITQNPPACPITKELFFTLELGTPAVNIPNMVSPNNDEKNDFWLLPQEYKNSNTEVLIISSTGKIVFQTKNYQDNWPDSSIEFKSVNPVFYYIITKEGAETKKGSITLIK